MPERHVKLAPPPAGDPSRKVVEAAIAFLWSLAPFAAELRPALWALLGGAAVGTEPVDVAVVVEPLGLKRIAYRECRAGKVEAAFKRGRRWFAPKDSLDEWLRQGGPRLVPDVPAEDDADPLEPARRRLASGAGRGRRLQMTAKAAR